MTVETGRDRQLGVFCIGLVCWTIGFLWHWFRVSLWLLDLVFVPAMGLLYGCGIAVMCCAAVELRRTEMTVLLAVLAATTMLVNPSYRYAPKTWFELHRPLFELARHTDAGNEYYGDPLPIPLRFLSANGNVSRVDTGGRIDPGSTIRFFPQWIGIPDDAGGYLYSPDGSPAGVDLYGMWCEDPVDLGGDWWMCNMADTGV